MRFAGKSFIVTGGAAGIGLQTALNLAREGARVWIGDRNVVGGEAAVRAADGEGLGVHFAAMDLEDGVSIDGFAFSAIDAGAGVDGLVNCAGGGGVSEPFLQNSPQSWERFLHINLLGMMRLTQALLPPMIERGRGRIVNISSEAGRIGMPGLAAYSAAKAGVIAVTRVWAREFAANGITVNCIAPGPIDTQLMRAAMPMEAVDQLVEQIPIGRIGTPQDVAGMISFFLDDANSYVTGQTVGVSGGMVMM